MNMITQNTMNDIMVSNFSNYFDVINKIAFPLHNNPSVFNYATLLEHLIASVRSIGLETLRKSLETMDLVYRNRPNRILDYYVKNTGERTIITILGPLTYNHTIYINRHNGSYYCHVDEQLGFPSYDTYAPCVRARATTLYANHNSMIKVGKLLGEEIFCPFSLSKQAKDYMDS